MQCANGSWVTIGHHPPLKRRSKSHSSNLSISQSNIQILRNCSINGDECTASLPLPSHVKSISSASNPFVKHCVKLRNSSSYRHSHGSVLVVGTTPIREIYRFQKSTQERSSSIECLLLLEKAEVPEDLDELFIRIVRVNSVVMKKVSGVLSNESIEAIALIRIPTTFHNIDDELEEPDFDNWFPSSHRVLVLEGIQDPGNLGTLLRSAMAFRWDGAFLLPGCCDPFNDKALRASRGASFQLPIVSGHWIQLELLRKQFQMKILAGHPESDEKPNKMSRLSHKFVDSLANTPLCLILGSEGIGLSKKSMEHSELVSIPMAGGFESLNVAVAGGIFLFTLQPESEIFT